MILPPGIRHGERKGFAIAMDPIYRVEDPVESYINFYKGSKKDRNLTNYTKRIRPWFLK
jgi:hypothetical protein